MAKKERMRSRNGGKRFYWEWEECFRKLAESGQFVIPTNKYDEFTQIARSIGCARDISYHFYDGYCRINLNDRPHNSILIFDHLRRRS